MASQPQKQPLKRTWKGRSATGCAVCRRRHIKCDEGLPECKNCLRVGLKCPGKTPLPPTIPATAPKSNPGWGQLETMTFHRFATHHAPNIGGNLNKRFWMQTLLPVAHTQEAIFNAALAVAQLYQMPKCEILPSVTLTLSTEVSRRYHEAVKWYTTSVKASISTAPVAASMDLILLSSVIYIYAEMRLGHPENVCRLMIAAFAVVHTSKAMESVESSITLNSLYQLLELTVGGPINSSVIPRDHRRVAMVHAIRIAHKMNIAEAYIIALERIVLVWDMNDIFDNVIEDDPKLSHRLDMWEQRFRARHKIIKQPPHPMVLMDLAYMRITWHVWEHGLDGRHSKLQGYLEQLLQMIEIISQFVLKGDSVAWVWILDTGLVQACLFVTWYSRRPTTLSRISDAIQKFPVQQEYVEQTLAYLEALTTTDFDQTTALETKILGGHLGIARIWQMNLCAQYLAEIAEPTTPSPVASTISINGNAGAVFSERDVSSSISVRSNSVGLYQNTSPEGSFTSPITAKS